MTGEHGRGLAAQGPARQLEDPMIAHPPPEFPHVVRRMTLADLKDVCRIDRDAFEAYRRAQRQLVQPLRLRTPENMQAAIRRRYPGVVIEQPPGTLVGYCFTHVWGQVGWLGTLGITPRRQGLGLGRAVTAAGLALLREAGCTLLALETMPESGKNLALYLSLGLEADHLTLVMQGTPPPAHETSYSYWDGGPALEQIGGRLCPGLDPTPAAVWLLDEDAGQTLLWVEDGLPAAFAVLRHGARRLQSVQESLTVEACGCVPEAAAHWPRYLAEMSAYARSIGKNGLVFPPNTRQSALTRALLAQGMRIVYTRVRMAIGGPIGAPDALLMLTLAM